MYTFEDLKQIMKTLRAEDGCPWDRAQDHETLKKHLVEECAEVLEAIDSAGHGKSLRGAGGCPVPGHVPQ